MPEGLRLEKEVSELTPYKVPNSYLEVQFMGWPTLCDSKTKVWWSGGRHMGSCYVCSASPNDFSKRNSPKFKKPRRSTYKYGLGALHVRLRFFDNVVKYYTYRDFKFWRIRYIYSVDAGCLLFAVCVGRVGQTRLLW